MKLFIKTVLCVGMLLIAVSALAKTRYPKDPVHSPITLTVANHLKAIVANGSGQNNNVFMIVGDSLSTGRTDGKNSWFLGQFEYPYATGNEHSWESVMSLQGYEELQPAHAFFLGGVVPHRDPTYPATSPYARYSLAAKVSMVAGWAITGNPSPLQREIDAINPKFALVMYGSNDVSAHGGFPGNIDVIISNILEIVDICISQGIVPIITAPHIRYDYDDASITLQYALRAACQDRQIPYINCLKAMMPLPDHGLGPNHNVHPNPLAWNRACVFHPEALDYGRNLRNLVTLQSLDRIYQIFENNQSFLDEEPPILAGSGTRTDPYIIDETAFVDAGETSASDHEFYYKLTVTEPFDMRAMVTDKGNTDIDVALLDSQFNVLSDGELLVERSVTAGTYYVLIKNNSGGAARSGRYQLVVMNRDILPQFASFPTTPGNFTASAVSAGSIRLTWDPATDNKGVKGYKVYRDRREIAVTTDLIFTDSGLTPATDYTYMVTSYDRADNESVRTPLLHVETLAGGGDIPAPPDNLMVIPVSAN